MLEQLRVDASVYERKPHSAHQMVGLAWRHRGFRAVVLFRLSQARFAQEHRSVGAIFSRSIHHLCHCEISRDAIIGPGLLLPHPLGVVVGAGSVVGAHCTIQQHVTIGGNYGHTAAGRVKPYIGEGVEVSAGAVIAGPVSIGSRARIGANAVVVTDVPPGAVVAAARSVIVSRDDIS
jgi:serine O-acetyltransferase